MRILPLAGATAFLLNAIVAEASIQSDFTFASQVESVIGTFGTPFPDLESGVANASAVLGAPDGAFIQLSDETEITVSFAEPLSGSGTLRIFAIDELLPAAARIEVSADNITFVELTPPLGTLFFDSSSDGFIDVLVDLSSDIQFVRLTDLVGAVDADFFEGGNFGFDLDAVGFSPASEPDPTSPIPEPTSALCWSLLTMVGVTLATGRRRL